VTTASRHRRICDRSIVARGVVRVAIRGSDQLVLALAVLCPGRRQLVRLHDAVLAPPSTAMLQIAALIDVEQAIAGPPNSIACMEVRRRRRTYQDLQNNVAPVTNGGFVADLEADGFGTLNQVSSSTMMRPCRPSSSRRQTR
jgi:hypothetical protein